MKKTKGWNKWVGCLDSVTGKTRVGILLFHRFKCFIEGDTLMIDDLNCASKWKYDEATESNRFKSLVGGIKEAEILFSEIDEFRKNRFAFHVCKKS